MRNPSSSPRVSQYQGRRPRWNSANESNGPPTNDGKKIMKSA
jgi:hypothetical protein